MENKGKFIVLDGPSGTGKSTQIKILKEKFPDAVFGTEPTYKLYGAVLRAIYERRTMPEEELQACLNYGNNLFSFWHSIHRIADQFKNGETLGELEMQLFYMADRIYDLKENILPALSAGKMYILDRYFFSTFAIGPSGGVSFEDLLQWHLKAFEENSISSEDWKPDLAVIFDLEAKSGMDRLKSSGKVIDIFEEKIERMEKIRDNYRKLAERRDLSKKVVLLDASRPIKAVADDLAGLISSLGVIG